MKTNYHKTPMIFQMEATECGAASMAMVFSYWGKHIPLEQMRVETGVSRDGCSAGNMMRAAKRLGMDCRGYHKEPDKLRALEMPCIIHWEFNHFVVLEGFKGRFAYLNDPAFGRRKVTLQELDDGFTGVVLTFHPKADFVKEKKKNTFFSMLYDRLHGLRGALLQIFLLGLFLIFPGFALPIMSQLFLDEIIGRLRLSWFPQFLAFLSLTILFETVLTFHRSAILLRMQNKMTLLSSMEFVNHLFRLPMSFYEQRYGGDLAGRVGNNNSVNEFLSGNLTETALNLVTAIFYFTLLLIYSPLLTLVGLSGVVFNLLLVYFTSSLISNMALKFQQDKGKLVGVVHAGLSITSTLKASGAEGAYTSRILGYNAKTASQEQIISRSQAILNAIPSVIHNGISLALLIIGGLFVIRGHMTLGMLSAFISMFSSFSEPVNELAGFAMRIQTLKADIERVDDIMRYPEEKSQRSDSLEQIQSGNKNQEAPNSQEDVPYFKQGKFDAGQTNASYAKLSGRIDCENVAFGYSILSQAILSNVSFTVMPGNSIAFVGFSGCGKSTISKLTAGLYHPWSGNIRFDGVPIEQIPPHAFHASVSTVSQNITLFSGSIRDNLTLWNPAILEQDIINAAKDACIHDTITQKPGAYNFHLEEGGKNLSGGQRQRLEIARALVTNPSILIMDEATSALDPIVEKRIIDNIKRRGCTCVIVAHRLSAVRNCDQILVMKGGGIVERGSHEELVKRGGYYMKFMQMN